MNLKTKLKDYNLCAKKVSKDVINYIKNEDFEKIGEHRDIDLIDIKNIRTLLTLKWLVKQKLIN